LPAGEKVAIGLGEQSRELPRLESMKNIAKIGCSDLVAVAVGDRQTVAIWRAGSAEGPPDIYAI